METLHFIAQYRNPILDTLFQTLTLVAQETLVVVIICWIYWCSSKKTAYTLGFTYFISGLLVQGLKITFRIPRPWVLDPDFQAVSSALEGASGYSFPSGHTQSGTALFSTLGFTAKKMRTKLLCFLMMLLIGFSRMYLGVHTPKDVLVSLILTFLISLFVFKGLGPHLTDEAHTVKISLGLLAISALLIGYTAALYISRTADLEMAADAFKACGAGFGFAVGYYLERKYIRFELPETGKQKALRFGAGLLSVVLLMVIFELTIKKYLIGDIVSYFILILWIVAIYPALFSRAAAKKR
ncbi:MAG: phosphatase PAP2 family protein [Clostridiales bacterium]|nr:phosphatase PAP2 family protein [Clostridiales bacterium]